MATFYLDHTGGNDSNDGTTFANRWKTINAGATSARIAAGDTIRVMATPDETLVGNATWTNNSKTVTLAGAVNLDVCTCETAWTASANVTATATGTGKEGTNYSNIAIATAFTTGLCAYFATGTLDLSGYQQLSFWLYNNANIAASTLSLRLCTDVAGATSVHTIAIPAFANNGAWIPVTVDLGSNMNSAIKSIALYQDSDIAAVTLRFDNIIACKASSSADSLSLTSLIGKVWNRSWVASATYASNDIRIPTQPNRNGYRYKVTAGGSGAAGSSEPTWPQDIGATVTDGALTWTCDSLEDTWYGIQSIRGVTVLLDNSDTTVSSSGRGYNGTTETVATYKRETYKMPVTAASVLVQKSGTVSSYITFSGGWNTTDMTTQTGETWIDGQNGQINGLVYTNGKNYVKLINLNTTRSWRGLTDDGAANIFLNMHHNNSQISGFYDRTSLRLAGSIQGMALCNSSGPGLDTAATGSDCSGPSFIALTCNNNLNEGIEDNGVYTRLKGRDFVLKNNATNGIGFNISATGVPTFSGLLTASNGNPPISCFADAVFTNCNFSEATIFSGPTQNRDKYLWSHRHQQTANNHLGTTDGGTISSATDQRHTASGISWKFNPTQTYRDSSYPLFMSVAKIAVTANNLVTLSIWTRRDSTNINGKLLVRGGQIPGVNTDVSVACAPSINTWTQSSNLTFTPTENGVVEVLFQVYDGVGTTNSFWIDDISITQA